MTNWDKLLGGYATGTLSPQERAALMQAALSDQTLFDLLMDEEALRETLADPATRSALLRALAPPAVQRAWWRNPWPWTALGASAAAAALIFILRPVDVSRPAQMAQNRPVAAAPVPEPVIIETPKQLRLSELDAPAPPAAPSRSPSGSPGTPAASLVAMAPPPPPPAPAPSRSPSGTPGTPSAPSASLTATAPPLPPAESSESATARQSAGAAAPAPVLMAKKSEAAAERDAGPLAVTLSYQAGDGAWRPLPLQSAIPAGRPLRLQVTSPQSGALALQPQLAGARAIQAGVAATIDLPAQSAGTLLLRLSLVPSAAEQLGRVANELRQSPARPVADSAAPARLTQELILRIE